MTRRILKRPQAKADVEEAFVFIAEINNDSGLDFLFAVEETLELLAANPLIGTIRRFNAPELENVRISRVKSYEKYLIFYLVRDDSIEILRLIHSPTDYTRAFDPEN